MINTVNCLLQRQTSGCFGTNQNTSVLAWISFIWLSAHPMRFNTQTANNQHTHISQRRGIIIAFDQGSVDSDREKNSHWLLLDSLHTAMPPLIFSFSCLFSSFPLYQAFHGFQIPAKYSKSLNRELWLCSSRATSCKGVAKEWLPFLWPDYRLPHSLTTTPSY